MDKVKWVKPSEHPGDWQEIRAEFGALLTDAQVYQAAGCIGYALRQVIRGEDLSEPGKTSRKGKSGKTIVRFAYDVTKTQSDDVDAGEAFELAALYVREGSPIRTTDRKGAGTRGTRLCEGIGAVNVEFFVR